MIRVFSVLLRKKIGITAAVHGFFSVSAIGPVKNLGKLKWYEDVSISGTDPKKGTLTTSTELVEKFCIWYKMSQSD